MASVLIIQERMREYRLPLYRRLAEALRADGVELRVAYSPPNRIEATKGDLVELDSGIGLRVPPWRAFGGKLVFQPLFREIARADLVVVEQANRLLMNHYLVLLGTLGRKRFAYWGHGWNRQGAPHGLGAWYKRKTLRRAHWWFAYTPGTARYLVGQGYPPGRITNVQNAIDTREFRRQLAEVAEDDRRAMRARLGIAPDARVGLFCGSLYAEKRIPFLLDAARRIRARVPRFELLVIGSGPDREIVEAAARELPWVHYAGPSVGREKAVLFTLAAAFINPGVVGLSIVDAFCAGLPFFTTDLPIHGPEIEYLDDGVNGLMSPPAPQVFADAVVKVLADAALCNRLAEGARASASRYTIEAMAENFRRGILQCLSR
jgi:glycosyltransferase involved in cell wall biosynthesis